MQAVGLVVTRATAQCVNLGNAFPLANPVWTSKRRVAAQRRCSKITGNFPTMFSKQQETRKQRRKAQEIPRQRQSNDFVSVARHLEPDEDKARFEAKLGQIAKARRLENADS